MKSCTNLRQSQKLKEILPIESADWHYVRMTYDFKGNPIDSKWSHPRYEQFVCPCCGWRSNYPKEFIEEYKKKWNK